MIAATPSAVVDRLLPEIQKAQREPGEVTLVLTLKFRNGRVWRLFSEQKRELTE